MSATESYFKIYPAMCKQQQDDLATMLTAIDDFGATALALSGNSVQGYSSFIEMRDQVRSLVHETSKNYRLVVKEG